MKLLEVLREGSEIRNSHILLIGTLYELYYERSVLCLIGELENCKNEMGEACSTCGESRRVYRVLVGKLEGKRPLGRSRGRWEDNIKMDMQEVGYGCVD